MRDSGFWKRAALAVAVLAAMSCKRGKTEAVADPLASSTPTAVPMPVAPGPSPTQLSQDDSTTPPSPPPNIPGPANLRAVDPTALLANARARAPAGSKLASLYVHYVGSNGLVDLGATTYAASIRYTFSKASIPATQTPGAPPGVVTPAKSFPDTIVTYEGSKVEVFPNQSLGRLGDSADSDPHCTVAQVWAAARAAGAPANAVANASFPANTLGSSKLSWSFHIEGVDPRGKDSFHTTIDDATCKVAQRDESGL